MLLFGAVMKTGHQDLAVDLLFKLMIIDRVSLVIDEVYPNQVYGNYNSPETFLAMVRKMVQIIDENLPKVSSCHRRGLIFLS